MVIKRKTYTKLSDTEYKVKIEWKDTTKEDRRKRWKRMMRRQRYKKQMAQLPWNIIFLVLAVLGIILTLLSFL